MRRRKAVAAKTREGEDGAGALSARERLLEAASELFYRQGIRSVGVDEIVAKADVAKMSLYRSFLSKDELAAAYLEANDAWYWDWWEGILARHAGDPRAAAAGAVPWPRQARHAVQTGAAAPLPTPRPSFPSRTIPHARSPSRTSASCAGACSISPAPWARAVRRSSPISSCCCSRAPMPACRPSAPKSPAAAVVEAAEALVAAQLG